MPEKQRYYSPRTGEFVDLTPDQICAVERGAYAQHRGELDRALLSGPWEGTGLWWDMRLKVAIDGIGA